MTESKDILVLGLGKSGRAVAKHSARLLAAGEVSSVTAVDARDTEALRGIAEDLETLGARVLLGQQEVTGRFDL